MTAWIDDPVVTQALAAGLAAIFLLGALGKLREPLLFEAQLAGYALLPAPLLRPAAWLLMLWEAAAGATLLAAPAHAPGLVRVLVLVLLAVVTSAVAVNLLRGHREIDCGCGGLAGTEQPLSWSLVARNAVLALAACGAVPAASPRALAALDYASTAAAALALLGLYAAANQLMANAPHLATLRRR